MPFSTFASYTYDENGNLTSDDLFTYEYSDRAKLSRVIQGTKVVSTYHYDHTGRRIKKVENGETCYYISSVYQSCDDGDTNHYFLENQRVAQKNPDGSKTFYHSDHIGSAVAYSDENGAVTKRIEYEPFGQIAEEHNLNQTSLTQNYTFSGKENDSTGNYYFEARYLNPRLARFNEVDPVTPFISDSHSLSPYAYTRNNPLKYVDYDGEQSMNFSNPALLEIFSLFNNIGRKTSDIKNKIVIDKIAAEKISSEELAKRPSAHNNLEDAIRHAETSRRIYGETNPITALTAGHYHELVDNTLLPMITLENVQPLNEYAMDVNNNREGRRAAKDGRAINLDSLISHPNEVFDSTKSVENYRSTSRAIFGY